MRCLLRPRGCAWVSPRSSCFVLSGTLPLLLCGGHCAPRGWDKRWACTGDGRSHAFRETLPRTLLQGHKKILALIRWQRSTWERGGADEAEGDYVESPVTIWLGLLTCSLARNKMAPVCWWWLFVVVATQLQEQGMACALADASYAGGHQQGSLGAVAKAWGGICRCFLKMVSLTGRNVSVGGLSQDGKQGKWVFHLPWPKELVDGWCLYGPA